MKTIFSILVLVTPFVHCLSDSELHSFSFAESKCGGKEKASTLLDVARDLMNKAKSSYPTCNDDEMNCRRKEKSFAYLELASNAINEVKKNFPKCPDSECPEPPEMPADCSEILQSGNNGSGVYTIWLGSGLFSKKPLTVYCDMDTDGGGWTVIQRRGNFSTPKDYFFRDWETYKSGFGNVSEEFWIGNDNIYTISYKTRNIIRFDLKDDTGKTVYAQYKSFWIEDESSNFTLHINNYSGNAGDAMGYHNNSKFSTKDRDNRNNCADGYKGGWWYNICTRANLNGIYQPGVDHHQSINWGTWKSRLGLAKVEIKLKPW